MHLCQFQIISNYTAFTFHLELTIQDYATAVFDSEDKIDNNFVGTCQSVLWNAHHNWTDLCVCNNNVNALCVSKHAS